MLDSWLEDRITATQTQITNAETVLDALLLDDTPANKMYTLNTGQSVVTVTKRDLEKVSAFIDRLYNRLATLEARKDGGGGQAIPV
jgi:hypothetical protein